MPNNEDPDLITGICAAIFVGGVMFVLFLLWVFQTAKP